MATASRFRWIYIVRHKPLITGACLAALALKLLMAATTFGTNDIYYWQAFARAVAAVGPVRVYSYQFDPGTLYNHPPLVGLFLVGINHLSRWGVPLNFTLRATCALADVGSTVLLYLLVKSRSEVDRANRSALLLCASPLLLAVSGFHGNTDPIFLMFVLLGVYLLVCQDSPLSAGAAMALAVSIKLVPVVVIPSLAVYAWRRRRSDLPRFLAGFIGLFVAIWGSALIREWGPLRSHVLGYAGISTRWWGLPQFASWLGHPQTGQLLAGHLALPIVAMSALTPAVLTWRRPSSVVVTTATSLALFLLLSPAIGVQYLVWPLAAAYLISEPWASAYNVLASALAVALYTRWSGSIIWNVADSTPPTPGQRFAGAVVWAALLAVVMAGLIEAYRPEPTTRSAFSPPKVAPSRTVKGLASRSRKTRSMEADVPAAQRMSGADRQ